MDFKKLEKDKLLKVTKKVTNNGEEILPFIEIEKKRFDPNTGVELEPEVSTTNPQALNDQLAKLQAQKVTLEAQIANVEHLLTKFK